MRIANNTVLITREGTGIGLALYPGKKRETSGGIEPGVLADETLKAYSAKMLECLAGQANNMYKALRNQQAELLFNRRNTFQIK